MFLLLLLNLLRIVLLLLLAALRRRPLRHLRLLVQGVLLLEPLQVLNSLRLIRRLAIGVKALVLGGERLVELLGRLDLRVLEEGKEDGEVVSRGEW